MLERTYLGTVQSLVIRFPCATASISTFLTGTTESSSIIFFLKLDFSLPSLLILKCFRIYFSWKSDQCQHIFVMISLIHMDFFHFLLFIFFERYLTLFIFSLCKNTIFRSTNLILFQFCSVF